MDGQEESELCIHNLVGLCWSKREKGSETGKGVKSSEFNKTEQGKRGKR